MAPQGSQPTIQPALYTNYGEGPIGPDGPVVLTYNKHPVWMITYTNVPSVASGGGAAPGETITQPPVEMLNFVGIVDSATGQNISAINANPDPTAYPSPDPIAYPVK